MTLELADLLAIAALVALPIGIQTFWISRSIGRVEASVDDVRVELRGFKTEVHADMQAHTTAITDLRERVAKLETS